MNSEATGWIENAKNCEDIILKIIFLIENI